MGFRRFGDSFVALMVKRNFGLLNRIGLQSGLARSVLANGVVQIERRRLIIYTLIHLLDLRLVERHTAFSASGSFTSDLMDLRNPDSDTSYLLVLQGFYRKLLLLEVLLAK